MNLQGTDVCLQQATVGGAKPAQFGPRTLPGSGWAPFLDISHRFPQRCSREHTLCRRQTALLSQPLPSRVAGAFTPQTESSCQLRFLLALKAGPESRTPGMMYQNRAMLVQPLKLFQRLCNVFICTQTGKSCGVLAPSV